MSVEVPHGGAEPATGNVPVLMYHSISSARAARRFRRFAVDPGEFAAQMSYLAAAGHHTVTAADLAESRLSGRPLPARPVVLTFDDAYVDFATTVLPVLRAHGFRATLYVPTACVGATARWMKSLGEGDRRILSWPALRDIEAAGVELASHSHTHAQLDRLPPAAARDEVCRSKALLEDNLAVQVEGFAYPFGYWSRAVRATVAGAGFRYAFAVADLVTAPGDDLFTLPRLTVNAGIGVDGLAYLLTRGPSPMRRHAAAVKRVVWRGLRGGARVGGGNPHQGWAR